METLKIFADIIEPEALNQIYAMAKSDAISAFKEALKEIEVQKNYPIIKEEYIEL